MPSIITVTLNTAIDRTFDHDTPTAPCVEEFPSGKGINVARAISGLGGSVTVLGLVGEGEAELFEKLASRRMSVELTPVHGSTRVNRTMRTPHGAYQRLQEVGFDGDKDDLERIAGQLSRQVVDGTIVVLSGSLPRGLPCDSYKRLIGLVNARGGVAVLDGSGDGLQYGLQAKPRMIKPNREELSELLGLDTGTGVKLLAENARALARCGIPMVVVSLGREGAIIALSDGRCLAASVNVAPTVGSSVGSGDAMVGGMVVAMESGADAADMLRLGVACGAANLLARAPGAVLSGNVADLVKRVRIRSLEA